MVPVTKRAQNAPAWVRCPFWLIGLTYMREIGPLLTEEPRQLYGLAGGCANYIPRNHRELAARTGKWQKSGCVNDCAHGYSKHSPGKSRLVAEAWAQSL